MFSTQWIKEKIKYIHQNPVKEMIVIEVEIDYFSSARNYSGLDSALLDKVCNFVQQPIKNEFKK
ncbi:hypothetical protein GCM10010992_12950 [Cloacibacterium rupense]|uniref:Uncharacterized protein n=1 Tax=Cloacibacterium rupense TaxID=517423 RepID=A0ABQ2NIX9_9FLAO|nr:hypothetical protein [Cloacibacterium rupense]GGP03674.1 hypothetical protein GCM10010992_12950 [Cloacibacterium rupense]